MQELNTPSSEQNLDSDTSNSKLDQQNKLVLLNLGCGTDIREEFINIDLIPANENVTYGDITELEYEEESVDGILALHILQCFPLQEVELVISELYSILKDGSELVVSVPSISLAAEEFSFENWSATKFNNFIFGEQTNEGNFYLSSYDVQTLRNCFEGTPFIILSIEEDLTELSIILRAIKPVKEPSSKIKLYIEDSEDDDIPYDDSTFESNWDEEDFDEDDIDQLEDINDSEIIVDENYEREIEAEIELFKQQINEIEEEFSEIIRIDNEDEILYGNEINSDDEDDFNDDIEIIQAINDEIDLDIDFDFDFDEELDEEETVVTEELNEDPNTFPIDFEPKIPSKEPEEFDEDDIELDLEDLIGEEIEFDVDEEIDIDDNLSDDFEIEILDIDTEFEEEFDEENEENEEVEDSMSDEEYSKVLAGISIPSSSSDLSLEIPISQENAEDEISFPIDGVFSETKSDEESIFEDFPSLEEDSSTPLEDSNTFQTPTDVISSDISETEEELDVELGFLLDQSIVEDDTNKIDFAFPSSIEPEETKIPEKQLNIFWDGSQFTYHSLALINREHCYNILRSGVADVTILPYEEDTFEPEGEKFELLKSADIRYKQEWNATSNGLPNVLIRHTWPPKTDAPTNTKWIIIQPWEFSEIRTDFVDIFQRADEVWVPSHFVRNVYVKAGISPDKVQVIPNGINPKLFSPLGELYPLDTQKQCKFLFVGGTIYRKGIDVLLQSYVSTFTKEDSVSLVIKDMGGDSFYKGQTAQTLIKEIQQNPEAPEIIYIDDQLSEEEMASLYRCCTVFVSPYRGEGFSLPTLEAMASGLPVIVTQGGPTDEYVTEDCGWIIPSTQTSIGNRFGNYDLTGNAFVLEPDRDALSDALLRSFAFPNECIQKGLNGSLIARTQLTWNIATMKALKRLDVLYNTTMANDAADVLQDTFDSSTIFAQAEVAFREKDFDTAIELYNNVYTIRGISAKLALLGVHRLAMIGIHDNEIEFVEDCLVKADEFVLDHPDTLYLKASLLALKQQWVEASEILTTLIENWDSYRFISIIGIRLTNLLCAAGNAIYYGSSDLEDRTEEVSAAHQLYSASLKDDPDNAEACYGTALCFYEFGLLNDAKKMAEWALQLSPDFTAATDLLQIIENESLS